VSPAQRFVRAAALLCAVAGPVLAQDAPLGSGLTFSGAPTMQEIQAQAKACESRKPPRKVGTISESLYRRMERIMVQVTKNQYGEAEQKLNELVADANGDYEKAIVLQTLGYVYAMQEKDAQSLRAYEQALATNALPYQAHEQMTLNVAQLYLGDKKTDKGMQVLNQYLNESCNPAPDAHVLLASLHAEKKEWREALKQIDLALIKAKAPKESWLQLKLALHYELKEFPRCAEVLVHLIALSPMKEDYFKQLNGMLLELKRDAEAMSVLALAERRGFIDQETEYRNLAAMYLMMDIPYKAATLLDRGLQVKQLDGSEKNLEMLSNAWLSAREYDKAESAMARAAQVSNKGELYKQLGQIQIENEKWKEALESLQKAQQKGNLKNPGEVSFLIGVAAVNLKQWKTAEAALRAAMEHEKTAQMATQWLNHLHAEVEYANAQEARKEADNPAGAPATKTN
jgi:tetratricopeptide (TPR) repeat protein